MMRFLPVLTVLMEEPTEVVSTSIDFSAITEALSAGVNVTTIGGVIAAVLGIAITPMLLMWGARKIVRGAKAALNGGLKI